SVVELAGKPIIQGCFRDITERKQVEEELRKSRQQLRNLSAHLLSVREQERTHIARELHDELGQALSILQIDLTWLENRLRTETDKKLWPEKVKSMSKLVETTIKEVQRISRELRPGVLDNLGLAAAVEWQAKEFHKRTGIRCKLCLGVEDMEIGKDLSTALFRILQEALTNVARHSKASSVKINLVEKANKLILRIQDNGRGITTKQISDPGSMGLIGMRERVNFMNGELMLQGVPNKGTTLTVSVPMAKKTFERLQTSQRLNVEG
ncbi:MAG: histidine kinase, partial [bacterium]